MNKNREAARKSRAKKQFALGKVIQKSEELLYQITQFEAVNDRLKYCLSWVSQPLAESVSFAEIAETKPNPVIVSPSTQHSFEPAVFLF
jgi:hypothetical protein